MTAGRWPSGEYDVPPTCPWCEKPIEDDDSWVRVPGTELFAHVGRRADGPDCYDLVKQYGV